VLVIQQLQTVITIGNKIEDLEQMTLIEVSQLVEAMMDKDQEEEAVVAGMMKTIIMDIDEVDHITREAPTEEVVEKMVKPIKLEPVEQEEALEETEEVIEAAQEENGVVEAAVDQEVQEADTPTTIAIMTTSKISSMVQVKNQMKVIKAASKNL